MDLAAALSIVRTPLYLAGTSDDALAAQVQQLAVPGGPPVRSVPQLHGGGQVCGADVLLSLAVATRPRYQADVHDAHAQWALLRYLGIFDALGDESPRLALSDAGRRVVGNQRRVLSEEMGIGFSTLLSGSWLLPGSAFGQLSVGVVDVDFLLASLDFDRTRISTRGSRRPDYLIVGIDSGQAIKIGLLECKGTRTFSYGLKQLAKGSEQLLGILFDSNELPGLVVSSVVADDEVGYLALERGESRVMAWADGAEDLSRAPADSPVGVASFVGLEVPEFSSGEEARSDSTHGGAASVVAPVLAASWAAIADLAGNEQGVARWGVPTGLRPTPRAARPRREYSSGQGTIRGVSNTISLPGGQLEVVLGLLDYVDDALASGDSIEVLEAQNRAARRMSTNTGFEGVEAYGSQGSALLLVPT